MKEKLLDYKTNDLLLKFGVGSHKPGSGSAAALEGLLSAQLVRTVVNISLKKPKFRSHFKRLEEIKENIDNRIYPQLKQYFQEDSDLFDLAVNLRIERNKETERKKALQLKREALNKLIPSTEMPIEIGKLCIELSEFAFFIFDKCYEAVRGDSGVSLTAAHAALGGCIFIIDLNLSSFPKDDWTSKIIDNTAYLREKYQSISEEIELRHSILKEESLKKNEYLAKIEILQSKKGQKMTFAKIENLANDLLNTMFLHKEFIWKKDLPQDALELINPRKILDVLGYKYNSSMSLGEFNKKGKPIEVAGIIDQESRTISISEQFPDDIKKFTIAHEIGHALLHDDLVLHRDRPLNGSREPKELKEKQADKFAAYLLMPKKQVHRAFQDIFKMTQFQINDDTLFLMNIESLKEFKRKFPSIKHLSQFLASTGFFNGRSFSSLAEIFGVSPVTMAIRLEELELVEYPK